MIERAGVIEIDVAARQHFLPARLAGERGDALHEARGDRRRACDLGGARENDLFGAQALREVVRGKTNAPLRRIEAQLGAHRAAEPWIAARFGRPGAFVESAKHDAIETSAGALPAGRRCARARRASRGGAPRADPQSWRGTLRRSRRARWRRRRRSGFRSVPRRRAAAPCRRCRRRRRPRLCRRGRARRSRRCGTWRVRRANARRASSRSSGASAAPRRAISSEATSNLSSSISPRGSLRCELGAIVRGRWTAHGQARRCRGADAGRAATRAPASRWRCCARFLWRPAAAADA